MGFGSFNQSLPGGLDPAYPLGLTGGTVRWGHIVANGTDVPADEQATDLQTPGQFSGRAFICTGFPNVACPHPVQALHTSAGDLFLDQPYGMDPVSNSGESLMAGLFLVASEEEGPTLVGELTKYLEQSAGTEQGDQNGGHAGIRYNAAWITDVDLGSHHYVQVPIFLTADADPAEVHDLHGNSAFVNELGAATVVIVANRQVVRAQLKSHQIYAYFDGSNSSAGFGSYAGGTGYPFSVSTHQSPCGDPTTDCFFAEWNVQPSLIDAVATILQTPADASSYTLPTQQLAKTIDLRQETMLTGLASSCVAFDPSESLCSNLTPVALATDRGDLLLHQPFLAYDSSDGSGSPYSINWGFFWADHLTR